MKGPMRPVHDLDVQWPCLTKQAAGDVAELHVTRIRPLEAGNFHGPVQFTSA